MQKKFFEEDIEFERNKKLEIIPLLHHYGMKGSFFGVDHTVIYYEYYKHPKEKAGIVISHGFCEFTAKFEEVIYYFFQQGYSVYILDHRGHGYSGRKVKEASKVYVKNYHEYVEDLYLFVNNIVKKYSPNAQLILYAHSMGGLIGTLFIEEHPQIFSLAILSSPMLEVEVGTIPLPLVAMITGIKKLLLQEKDFVPGHKPFNGLSKFEASSCDSKVRYEDTFQKRLNEVHYQTYGATYAWLWASLLGAHQAKKNGKKIKIPVLLLQAQNDTVVRNRGQNVLAHKNSFITLVRVKHSKHELYNSNQYLRRRYYNYIFRFIKQNLVNESLK